VVHTWLGCPGARAGLTLPELGQAWLRIAASEGAAGYTDRVQVVVLQLIAGFSVEWDSWPVVEQMLQFLVHPEVCCDPPLRLHVPLVAALLTPIHFLAQWDDSLSDDDDQDGGAGGPRQVARLHVQELKLAGM
jgi:hypothetical protein